MPIFNIVVDIRKHIATIPKGGALRISTRKPFTFLVCGKTFGYREILNAHKEREHNAAITEPCKTLTTPDGYGLNQEGKRAVACVLGAGILLSYDLTGATFVEAQGIAKATGRP